jgi:hypothetical protein
MEVAAAEESFGAALRSGEPVLSGRTLEFPPINPMIAQGTPHTRVTQLIELLRNGEREQT